MSKPNLFDYATSELSHDAFIAWLLEWASSDNAGNPMHEFGRDVIQTFFKIQNKSLPSYSKVHVSRQYKNIDVFATLDTPQQEEWAIIIENKIYTREHSGQLKKYWELVRDEKNNIPEDRMIGIYYKMWEQSDMQRVRERGYAHFDRKNMLALMDRYKNKIDNDIFQNYYSYIKRMQEELDAFLETPISEWKDFQWVGFYSSLKEDLNDVEAAGDNNFGYVPNPSGGFWGSWLGSHNFDTGDTLYLQSEQKKLCFKINVNMPDKRQHAKWFWHHRVKRTAKEMGLEVVKPKVMRVGTWFTIGVLKTESDIYWMPTHKDGCIDYPATLEQLKQSLNLIQKCVIDYRDEYHRKMPE
ncbi:MAG: PD-(D/E)XK nuclease family protein [Balneolaceae bacterium]